MGDDWRVVGATVSEPGPAGLLAQRLQLTIFPNLGAKRLSLHDTTLLEFADVLRNARAPTKEQLQLVSLCTFGRLRSAERSLRHDQNVIQVAGVVGDYDAERVTLAEAEAALRQADICALLVTSPNYTPECPRWRVYVPFSEPLGMTPNSVGLTLGDYPRIADRLCVVLPELAPESRKLSQSWYVGAFPPATHHGTLAIAEGGCLLARSDLDATPAVYAVKDRLISPRRSVVVTPGEPLSTVTVEACLAAIADGQGSHDALITVIGKLASQGVPQATVIELLRFTVDCRSPEKRDAGWTKLRRDIERTVAWAYEKEAESDALMARLLGTPNTLTGASPNSPPPQPSSPPSGVHSGPSAQPPPPPQPGSAAAAPFKTKMRNRNPRYAGNLEERSHGAADRSRIDRRRRLRRNGSCGRAAARIAR